MKGSAGYCESTRAHRCRPLRESELVANGCQRCWPFVGQTHRPCLVGNPDLRELPIGSRDEYVCPSGVEERLTRGVLPDTLLIDQQVMAVTVAPGTRIRDAARSRQAILDAAEGLFAERGYGATTMADVAAGAGLSRGAPAYFFNSKDELYRAVLGRAFDESLQLILSFPLGEGDLQRTLEAGVGAYLDFLAARPNFVRLVVRECLEGGRFLQGLPEHVAAITAAIGAFVGERKRGGLRGEVDPAHLVLSAISLCWFPMIAVPLVEDLGLPSGTPKFLGARKEQVARLISRGALSEATS